MGEWADGLVGESLSGFVGGHKYSINGLAVNFLPHIMSFI